MAIKINFTAQIKRVMGVAAQQLDVETPIPLQELLRVLVSSNDELKGILFEENGGFKASNLLVVNRQQVHYQDNPIIAKGDELTLMSPISGG